MSSRKPLNTENEVDIFTHTNNSDTTLTNGILINRANSNAVSNDQQQQQQQPQRAENKFEKSVKTTMKANNALNNIKKNENNGTPLRNYTNQIKPLINNNQNKSLINSKKNNLNLSLDNSDGFQSTSRANTGLNASLPRIVKRELWWKEAPKELKIPEAKPFKPIVAAPKVDHINANYQPPVSSRTKVESHKLQWNAQPAVNTWENFHHQPGGGNKRYPEDNVEWNALPKIDTGFIYTYDSNNERHNEEMNEKNLIQRVKEYAIDTINDDKD